MQESKPEGVKNSGTALPTRIHAATRAKLADTMRLIAEGVPLDQALLLRRLLWENLPSAAIAPGVELHLRDGLGRPDEKRLRQWVERVEALLADP